MSTDAAYFVGQEVRLTATFFGDNDELAEPSTVAFKVIDGEGNQITYAAPSKVSAGAWEQLVSITCSGTWTYRAEGAGAINAAAQKSFGVEPDPFT